MENENATGRWYWFPVTGPDYAGAGYFVILETDGATVCNPSPMGQEAAYLIAAAPMMLDALRRLVHPAADDTDLENARDVIARATGAP
jgi:hypothetical protein